MTRRTTWTALGVLALALCLAGPERGAASFPGVNGKIAFGSERGFDDLDLWVAEPDGNHARRLVDLPGQEQGAAWSPDGRRLAFANHRAESVIFVVNADGSGLRRLRRTLTSHSDPAWSPDGTRIVFAGCCAEGRETLYVMNADGTARRPLTDLSTYCASSPEWSPDGRMIVFRSGCERRRLAVIPASGRGPKQEVARAGTEPAWSPDGSRIAFARENRVVTVGLDLPGETTVASTRTFFTSGPAWSPDGRWLVVAERDRETCGSDRERLIVVSSDGSGMRRELSTTCADDISPAWQPRCTLTGSNRPDRLVGTAGPDVICGLRGADRIAGLAGNDVILGGDGGDTVFGGPGADRLFGAAGGDHLYARDGARDVVDGGPGRDYAETDPIDLRP